MTLSDVMERAHDAALQQRDETLGRVRVGIAAHEFACAVIHGLALHAGELLMALTRTSL
jgi:hypothetical protein